jgi:hypothetical protein
MVPGLLSTVTLCFAASPERGADLSFVANWKSDFHTGRYQIRLTLAKTDIVRHRCLQVHPALCSVA